MNQYPESMSDAEYKALWKTLGPLEIKMVELHGKCRYSLGDTFYYKHPYARPDGACFALLHVLDLYTWRCALGFPSWEGDDRSVFRIHCPSKRGSVWELRRVHSGEGEP